MLSNRLVDDFVLATTFIQVESLVNSRPLTPISDDKHDLECLTPNHFLIGRPSPNLSPCLIYKEDVDHRKRWRRVQSYSNLFWCRWVKEYLPNLTKRSKWTTEMKNFKVGDVVILMETNLPKVK